MIRAALVGMGWWERQYNINSLPGSFHIVIKRVIEPHPDPVRDRVAEYGAIVDDDFKGVLKRKPHYFHSTPFFTRKTNHYWSVG